jgi:hypothetical protein
LYHADLESTQGGDIITDIAIQNPDEEEDVTFPDTSTVIIGINRILPGGAQEHAGEE